jgi:hypothetical protein
MAANVVEMVIWAMTNVYYPQIKVFSGVVINTVPMMLNVVAVLNAGGTNVVSRKI